VAKGLPWPESLVGELPSAYCSGALARSFVAWATDFPEYAVPTVPTLLLASDLDVVAPPETVRLPSADWPDRTWHRIGIQSLARTDPSHADLLLAERVAERVAEFLAEDL
jgi:hypothetical protein